MESGCCLALVIGHVVISDPGWLTVPKSCTVVVDRGMTGAHKQTHQHRKNVCT